jgi:hypothetical protein
MHIAGLVLHMTTLELHIHEAYMKYGWNGARYRLFRLDDPLLFYCEGKRHISSDV